MSRFLSACCAAAAFVAPLFARANAGHILVVEIDGVSPESLRAEDCPTLTEMARRGFVFRNHHGTFPASANAAIAEIATGAFPGANGILADREFRRALDPHNPVDTAAVQSIRTGDSLTADQYLSVSTLPELLRAQSPSLPSLFAGAEQNLMLADRALRKATSTSLLLAAGDTLPGAAVKTLAPAGIFPPLTAGNMAVRDEWTVSVVTDVLWAEAVPPLTFVRLAEPAYSVRCHGTGSPEAAEALGGADMRLSALLGALAREETLDNTDVIVVSGRPAPRAEDFSDVTQSLRAASLPVTASFGSDAPEGSVMTVENGGALFVYVKGRTPETVEKVSAVLHALPGALFTPDGSRGTLPLKDAGLATETAPDFLLLRGYDTPDANRTLLIAMGPDFKAGASSELPSANADLAPTVLWILGLDKARGATGRVLGEALTISAPERPAPEAVEISVPAGNGTYYLKGTKTGTSLSIDAAGRREVPASAAVPPQSAANTPQN